ncbi:MAG TPA: 16S rRNA (cytosine(1402)-N(4))-methyltransferase RsmH [Candidatus Mucispirillum faecigallinarum]|uniref:Ribosomal RNA small subunit methyltransferase H n=1 Tax=Candidatus Mucispirillum faecigallinarum TaxID=2838699 RepID=A0A9D2KB22_9BACT|nr:16S rRNA (cytosine(1402)-N(4))-methyltransferase RsmH [Candidatus Mucispirillum faecigallinarum]
MHISVLYHELIESLNVSANGIYVDCTGGGGGHASLLLEKLSNQGRLIILDRDIDAVKRLNDKFAEDSRVSVVHSNFADIDKALESCNIAKVDGIYADFGVSSFQLQEAERGFSFRKDGPLDMRMDTTCGEPVSEVVNSYSESNLSTIIYKYGEERFSRQIAAAVVKRRAVKPFTTTLDFAEVVKSAIPKKFHKKGINPATKTFQAFRIFVNAELDAVESLMSKISSLLKPNGRFAAISFHSLEDRIVKEWLHHYAAPCTCPDSFPVCVCGKEPEMKIITKKPIVPTEKEVHDNPLSRSAKLRVAERI